MLIGVRKRIVENPMAAAVASTVWPEGKELLPPTLHWVIRASTSYGLGSRIVRLRTAEIRPPREIPNKMISAFRTQIFLFLTKPETRKIAGIPRLKKLIESETNWKKRMDTGDWCNCISAMMFCSFTLFGETR